jgi:hypothetical protein
MTGAPGLGQDPAVCGPDFFDDMITHLEVEKAYERWLDGAFLRQGQARGGFAVPGLNQGADATVAIDRHRALSS